MSKGIFRHLTIINRVTGVVSRHFNSGEMPVENRGGNRKETLYILFAEKKQFVLDFIKKFKVLESHYCRSKTSCRLYLSSDLNITKMWRLYDSKTNDGTKKVKQSYFRHIFVTNYNIGFGSPRTDECSICLSLSERIKHSTDPVQKHSLKQSS